jgi:Amt family ammonium transporter
MGILGHAPHVRAQWGIWSLLLLMSLVVAPPRHAYAQEAETEADETAAAVEADAKEEADETEDTAETSTAAEEPYVPDAAEVAGHTSWMLTSSALVLFMTAPGLAMFYGGLVRKKNILSVMMQCLFLMGLMTVIWALYGYSLAFGGSDPYIGNGEYLFMNNVQRTWDATGGADGKGAPVELYFNKTPLPMFGHMVFQGMFFIITPALICGAFAERMKFSSMVVFSILWGTLVYCPLCHWVWDGGILAFNSSAAIANGALDFAGGTVVHISSGVSALVCALLLGKRKGFGHDDMRPHNLTYTALGAGMLWVGWFGFNAGSELLSDHLASSAFVATHFSAAAGVLGWSIYEWLHNGKPSVLGAASGAVAGLVVITPAAGFVNPMPALAMGFIGGIVCALACGKLKPAMGYDDSLDAFGVHGVGGTLGAILTGVFATRACWNIDSGAELGLIEGGKKVFMGQLAAVGVTWVFSIVATVIIFKVIDAVMGMRATEEAEVRGLDISDHGEEGYIFV